MERNLTIVCLHGLGRSASDWDGVRSALERYGEVHAPDLPRAVAGLVLTDGFFPPALNGRSRAATLVDYGRHRLALVREIAARGGRSRRGAMRGMSSLGRLGTRPEAFHAIAAAVHAPVLVVHSRDDHHVPVDFAMAAAGRCPAWTLELLASGGHAPHVECPAEWLHPVTRWLEQHAA